MMSGSGPMGCRLAAWRAGQPPGRARAATMPESVSPGRTVHVTGLVAALAVTSSVAAVTGRAVTRSRPGVALALPGALAGLAWVPGALARTERRVPGASARAVRGVPGSLARGARVLIAVLVIA